MTETWNVDQYHEHMARAGRPNKYHARKVKLDGITFDSQAEADRYRELRLLADQGYIQRLRVHPTYLLQEPFQHNGKRIQAIHYEADFEYWDGGVWVVEDVKGYETAVFKIKRKLFLRKYPDADFRLVTK